MLTCQTRVPVKTERGTGSAVDSPCVHWTYPPGRSSPATKSPWNRDHWIVFGHLREQAIKLAVHISNDERVLWEALVLAQALWQGESATLAQPLRKELGITSQPKQTTCHKQALHDKQKQRKPGWKVPGCNPDSLPDCCLGSTDSPLSSCRQPEIRKLDKYFLK